ncbi:ribosome assembly factor SBDS, partial [Candidatus Altiarchaeota archaeon]
IRYKCSQTQASEEVMQEVFETKDALEAAKQVVAKGELHLTTDQRRRMQEERRKQIVEIIAKNAINPQTKTPHPPARIEKAMEEARVTVDPHKSAQEQVEKILKVLQPLIPIRFEKIKVAVKIPSTYAGKAYNILREFGEVDKEEWIKGDLMALVSLPAGLQDEFIDKLNNFSHGEVELKILK